MSSEAAAKAARFVIPISKESLPKGFAVSATYAGIKAAISPKLSAPSSSTAKANPKPDLALIVSSTPASAAGTFTKNVFKAAPVIYSSEVLTNPKAQGKVRSVLVNSGCANAVTGQQGYNDTQECAKMVQDLFRPAAGLGKQAASDEPKNGTLVLSTGVIGVPLPMQTIKKSLPHLASGNILRNDSESWMETARAFMTTDTFPKLRTRTFKLAGLDCKMVGLDKGAGMIHPSMTGPRTLHATLLGLIATDAPVEPASLQQALDFAVSRSFNCISVDGDMSTNDTILVLANGQAAASSPSNSQLKLGEEISAKSHPQEYETFVKELTAFCMELSHLIVRDGEGATKFVSINVKNTPTYEQAHAIASSVSTSALVKCALHGADANWGRILCAVGYTRLPGSAEDASAQEWRVDPAKVTVKFVPPATLSAEERKTVVDELVVLKDGVPQEVDEDKAAHLLSFEDIDIVVDLQGGSSGSGVGQKMEQATYWTCDFSKVSFE
jgi:glutamate N-acetyltransferase / amino-acid N-acetyltransferase